MILYQVMEILAMKKFLRMLTEKANEFINDKKTEQNSENNTADIEGTNASYKTKTWQVSVAYIF